MKMLFALLALQMSSSAFAQETVAKWYERTNISGDLRLRDEYIDDDTEDETDNRVRTRVRLNIDSQIAPEAKAYFQLSTGGDSATGMNQTYDTGYTKKSVNLSRAYIQWSPSVHFDVLAGKVKNTLYAPGDSELLIDSDVNPEGATLNWRMSEEKNKGLFANLGVYTYDDTAAGDDGSDVFQYSAQVGTNLAFGENLVVLGLGQHVFAPTHIAFGEGGGNTVTAFDGGDTTIYTEDFSLSEAFVNLTTNVASMPLTVYAHYVQNGEASDDNTAYLAGFYVGQTKAKGDWLVGYNYRDSEANGVLSSLNDSDFADGQTDSRGHRVIARYQIANYATTGLTYYIVERAVSTTKDDYQRGQIDLVVGF